MERYEVWERAAAWAGNSLDERAHGLLSRYHNWLLEEALPAGGLGRSEGPRLPRRHIADSLLFGLILEMRPREVWDLGSGVGLPGIPLAILRPDVDFILLDRSGKRTDLMRRAVRILDMKNVQVKQGEIENLDDELPAIVSRATLPAQEAAGTLERLIQSPGMALLGGSWRQRPEIAPWETVTVPAVVLDHEVWLLKMLRP